MPKKLSKRRLEMGEEAWAEYQRIRKNKKGRKYTTTERGQKRAFHVKQARRKIKRLLIEYKGGKCERCGYSGGSPAVYDFHHKNPDEKEFGIARANIGLETQKKEVDKCMLVCANCHREIHNEAELIKIEEERIRLGL